MAFTLLPAIDVSGGRVARTAAAVEPGTLAGEWQADGAQLLHLVALDAALGRGTNAEHRLAARGGHRDGGDLWATIERLDRAGCRRYVVTPVDRDGRMDGPDLDLHRARRQPAASTAASAWRSARSRGSPCSSIPILSVT